MTPEELLESAKSEMLRGLKNKFNIDRMSNTDTLSLNSREDILFFIEWVQKNSRANQ